MTPDGTPVTAPPIETRTLDGGTLAVLLRGEHDLSSKPALAAALALAAEHQRVLVDLSECTFADSTVLAVLLSARAEAAERGGRLELLIPPEAVNVARIAHITGLAGIVTVHRTQEAADASLRPMSHELRVRDLRERFGDAEARAAHCSCGWVGETRSGPNAERVAKRDGAEHLDRMRAGDPGSG